MPGLQGFKDGEETKGQQAGKILLSEFLAQVLGLQGVAWGSPIHVGAGELSWST